jgi:hypothetical protein
MKIIHDRIGVTIGAVITWLEPDLVQLTIREYRTLTETKEYTWEISPADAAELADYINRSILR